MHTKSSWVGACRAAVVGGIVLGLSSVSGAAPVALNIDVDFPFPGEPGNGVPSAVYAAASGQTGTWTPVGFGAGPFNLTAANGMPSGVQMTRSLVPVGSTFDFGSTGDYPRLVYDADRIDSTLIYTFSNLPAGEYIVYTYAAAPTFGTVATRITINGSAQLAAGAPTDETFQLGASHTRHQVIHGGGAFTIRADKASINGVVNGFQFVPVVVQPPGAFALTAPANSAVGVSPTPVLSWSASSTATGYRVVLDDDAAFTPPSIIDETTTNTSLVVASGLLDQETQYFWRVVATNAGGQTVATPDPATFTTQAAPPPPPVMPFGVNIDFEYPSIGDPGTGVPSSSYSAASAQTGAWNAVSFGTGPFALVGLNGQASPATLARSLVPPSFSIDLGTTGNYPRLVFDADRIDGPMSYTINGLPQGNYDVYTYAAAPTFGTIATRVTIQGSPQLVAAAPTDESFSLGASHALHTIAHPGGPLVISVDKASINGVVNGLQIVPRQITRVEITDPQPCSYRNGVVEVSGTAAAPGLTSWTLEYTGGAESGWVPIATSTTPVVGGLLANWDARGLSPCGYTLRLRASAGTSSIETMRSLILAQQGDVNLDGAVTFEDITLVLVTFNQNGP